MNIIIIDSGCAAARTAVCLIQVGRRVSLAARSKRPAETLIVPRAGKLGAAACLLPQLIVKPVEPLTFATIVRMQKTLLNNANDLLNPSHDGRL